MAIPEDARRGDLAGRISKSHQRGQILYPVVDGDLRLTGVITGRHLKDFLDAPPNRDGVSQLVSRDPIVAYPDEPLRAVVYRMAETGKTRLPVVERAGSQKLVGLISLRDLLHARVRAMEEERKRERVLRIRLPGAPARTGV